MLKNWIVKTTQIKNKENGLINHVNYLIDKNRVSHHYTKIKVLTNNAKNIIKAVKARQLKRKSQGLRGGGVTNYCTSFILTVPRDIKQPTAQDWQKIVNITFKYISQTTGLDEHVIRDHAFAVLHDEGASADKSSHVHLLISNVINGDYQKKITQKAVTYAVKKAINKGVMLTVGENNNSYMPKRKQRSNKPLWVVRQEKNNDIEKKLKELKKSYHSVISSIKDWANHYLLSLARKSEQHANIVSTNLDYLNNLSVNAERAFEPVIMSLESQNIHMPDETKITPKRKRRRRKR